MASYPINPSPLGNSSTVENFPEMIESEAEDEVDELDSDSDAGETGNDVHTKTNGLAEGQRIPGHSLLPSVRLENIIQAEGVTGNLALSKEGLFILSIATEEFIKRMAEAGYLKANSERRATVNYGDMAAATQQYQEFMFLDETIPTPLSLSEALLMRDLKEKELFDDDPAMSAPTSSSPYPSASASIPFQLRVKAKFRNANNGQEQKNGSTSSTKREKTEQRGYGEVGPSEMVNGSRSWDNRVDGPVSGTAINGRSSFPIPAAVLRQSPLANGDSPSSPSRSGTITPAPSRDGLSEHPSPRQFQTARTSPLTQEERWPGQYMGPASGFLQGPGGPFGRVAQNPGRTIYSQQHRID